MTGDVLKPDEHPLSPTSEYLIIGKDRPRRFLPSGSPYLKNAKPLQTDGEGEEPETQGNERLVQRLRKAGFVEIEPDAWDKRHYAFCERLRNMSPEETAREWQGLQREARERLGIDKKSFGEKLGDFTFELFDLMMRLLLGLPPEQEERKMRDKPTPKPA
jgi:hypothetical protein